jgi:ABC-2 type transport system permease protein
MAMLLVIVAFALFASGFMAFVAALARNERRADVLNSVLIMMIAFIGGSFFPARQLPGLLRDHISPLMPNYWFIESIRALQGQGTGVSWTLSAIKLAVVGAVLVFVRRNDFPANADERSRA